MLGKLIHGQFFKPFLPSRGDGYLPRAPPRRSAPSASARIASPVAGAGHNVSLGDLGGLLGESLGIAAGQHRHRAGVLALGAAQPLTAFLITEIRDGAAVDDIDIGPSSLETTV